MHENKLDLCVCFLYCGVSQHIAMPTVFHGIIVSAPLQDMYHHMYTYHLIPANTHPYMGGCSFYPWSLGTS